MRVRSIRQTLWALISVVRCIRRLGPLQAGKLWLLRNRQGIFRVRAPGYLHPFTLRGSSSDSWVFEQVVIGEQYGAGLEALRPRTIIDAGANAGYATRYFKKLWPDAEIVVVEPDEDNARLAEANLKELAGVTLVRAGLWSRVGRASFVTKEDAKYALRLRMDPSGEIETITVDALMDRMGWDRVDLLKMDIEGGEREVFDARATSWIDRVGVLAVELHEDVAPGCTKKLFDSLRGVDFTLKWRGENLFIFLRADGDVGAELSAVGE